LIYVDTSAFLKTVFDEPQAPAIARYLAAAEAPRLVSSTLLAVEARRGALRAAPRRLPRVDVALSRIAQIEMDGPLVEAASRLPDPMLRSLDAIHLATALMVRDDLDVLLTYDQRMLTAAAAHGLTTASPA
jgi:predicted nucleic acid-binding protein